MSSSTRTEPPREGFGPPHRRLLTAIGLYHGLNDAAVVTLAPLLPLLRIEMAELYQYDLVGLLMGAGLAVTMVGQYLVGRVADRHDPRWLLAGGLTLLGGSLLLLSKATTFLEVLVLVLLLRAGASFYHPVGISWLGRRFKGRRLDRAMGLQSACGDAGVLAGVVVAGLVGASLGWRVPLVAWGLLNLAGVAVGLALTLSLPRLAAPTLDTRAARSQRPSTAVLVRRVAPDLVSLAVGGAVFGITLTYLPFLAVDELGVAPAGVAWLLGLWLGTGTLAAISYHRALQRASRPRLLAAAFGLAGLAGLLLWAAPGVPEGWALAVVGLALIISGFGLFTTYPVQFALISSKAGAGTHGATFGLVFAFQIGGSASLVLIGGWLADWFGSVRLPFALLGLLGLASAVNAARWVREGREAEATPA